jgi:hypothetical protein
MTDQVYFLSDQQAQEIWAGMGIFGPADGWNGNARLRAYILASIRRGTSPSADTELGDFLQKLDAAFRQSNDLLERHAFAEMIALWSPVASNALFDTKHAEWADKPYYRCQIARGICLLFIGYANLSDEVETSSRIEHVLKNLSRMIELVPIDPQIKGYFYGNETAAAAQNYNLAQALKLGAEWMKAWGPEMISVLSKMPKSEAQRIESALQQRTRDTAKYLET